MPTQIDICNMALGYNGLPSISSLTAQEEKARICNLFYDQSRRTLLEIANWNFALRNVELNLTNEELDGWSYVYSYPSNCIRIVSVYPKGMQYIDSVGNLRDFIVYNNSLSQKLIATNFDEAMIMYIHDVSDTTLFSNGFIECLSLMLASKISVPLTGDQVKAKRLYDMFLLSLGTSAKSSLNESGFKFLPNNSKYYESR